MDEEENKGFSVPAPSYLTGIQSSISLLQSSNRLRDYEEQLARQVKKASRERVDLEERHHNECQVLEATAARIRADAKKREADLRKRLQTQGSDLSSITSEARKYRHRCSSLGAELEATRNYAKTLLEQIPASSASEGGDTAAAEGGLGGGGARVRPALDLRKDLEATAVELAKAREQHHEASAAAQEARELLVAERKVSVTATAALEAQHGRVARLEAELKGAASKQAQGRELLESSRVEVGKLKADLKAAGEAAMGDSEASAVAAAAAMRAEEKLEAAVSLVKAQAEEGASALRRQVGELEKLLAQEERRSREASTVQAEAAAQAAADAALKAKEADEAKEEEAHRRAKKFEAAVAAHEAEVAVLQGKVREEAARASAFQLEAEAAHREVTSLTAAATATTEGPPPPSAAAASEEATQAEAQVSAVMARLKKSEGEKEVLEKELVEALDRMAAALSDLHHLRTVVAHLAASDLATDGTADDAADVALTTKKDEGGEDEIIAVDASSEADERLAYAISRAKTAEDDLLVLKEILQEQIDLNDCGDEDGGQEKERENEKGGFDDDGERDQLLRLVQVTEASLAHAEREGAALQLEMLRATEVAAEARAGELVAKRGCQAAVEEAVWAALADAKVTADEEASQRCLVAGREEGYSEGFAEGFSEGREQGWRDGFDDGARSGGSGGIAEARAAASSATPATPAAQAMEEAFLRGVGEGRAQTADVAAAAIAASSSSPPLASSSSLDGASGTVCGLLALASVSANRSLRLGFAFSAWKDAHLRTVITVLSKRVSAATAAAATTSKQAAGASMRSRTKQTEAAVNSRGVSGGGHSGGNSSNRSRSPRQQTPRLSTAALAAHTTATSNSPTSSPSPSAAVVVAAAADTSLTAPVEVVHHLRNGAKPQQQQQQQQGKGVLYMYGGELDVSAALRWRLSASVGASYFFGVVAATTPSHGSGGDDDDETWSPPGGSPMNWRLVTLVGQAKSLCGIVDELDGGLKGGESSSGCHSAQEERGSQGGDAHQKQQQQQEEELLKSQQPSHHPPPVSSTEEGMMQQQKQHPRGLAPVDEEEPLSNRALSSPLIAAEELLKLVQSSSQAPPSYAGDTPAVVVTVGSCLQFLHSLDAADHEAGKATPAARSQKQQQLHRKNQLQRQQLKQERIVAIAHALGFADMPSSSSSYPTAITLAPTTSASTAASAAAASFVPSLFSSCRAFLCRVVQSLGPDDEPMHHPQAISARAAHEVLTAQRKAQEVSKRAEVAAAVAEEKAAVTLAARRGAYGGSEEEERLDKIRRVAAAAKAKEALARQQEASQRLHNPYPASASPARAVEEREGTVSPQQQAMSAGGVVSSSSRRSPSSMSPDRRRNRRHNPLLYHPSETGGNPPPMASFSPLSPPKSLLVEVGESHLDLFLSFLLHRTSSILGGVSRGGGGGGGGGLLDQQLGDGANFFFETTTEEPTVRKQTETAATAAVTAASVPAAALAAATVAAAGSSVSFSLSQVEDALRHLRRLLATARARRLGTNALAALCLAVMKTASNTNGGSSSGDSGGGDCSDANDRRLPANQRGFVCDEVLLRQWLQNVAVGNGGGEMQVPGASAAPSVVKSHSLSSSTPPRTAVVAYAAAATSALPSSSSSKVAAIVRRTGLRKAVVAMCPDLLEVEVTELLAVCATATSSPSSSMAALSNGKGSIIAIEAVVAAAKHACAAGLAGEEEGMLNGGGGDVKLVVCGQVLRRLEGILAQNHWRLSDFYRHVDATNAGTVPLSTLRAAFIQWGVATPSLVGEGVERRGDGGDGGKQHPSPVQPLQATLATGPAAPPFEHRRFPHGAYQADSKPRGWHPWFSQDQQQELQIFQQHQQQQQQPPLPPQHHQSSKQHQQTRPLPPPPPPFEQRQPVFPPHSNEALPHRDQAYSEHYHHSEHRLVQQQPQSYSQHEQNRGDWQQQQQQRWQDKHYQGVGQQQHPNFNIPNEYPFNSNQATPRIHSSDNRSSHHHNGNVHNDERQHFQDQDLEADTHPGTQQLPHQNHNLNHQDREQQYQQQQQQPHEQQRNHQQSSSQQQLPRQQQHERQQQVLVAARAEAKAEVAAAEFLEAKAKTMAAHAAEAAVGQAGERVAAASEAAEASKLFLRTVQEVYKRVLSPVRGSGGRGGGGGCGGSGRGRGRDESNGSQDGGTRGTGIGGSSSTGPFVVRGGARDALKAVGRSEEDFAVEDEDEEFVDTSEEEDDDDDDARRINNRGEEEEEDDGGQSVDSRFESPGAVPAVAVVGGVDEDVDEGVPRVLTPTPSCSGGGVGVDGGGVGSSSGSLPELMASLRYRVAEEVYVTCESLFSVVEADFREAKGNARGGRQPVPVDVSLLQRFHVRLVEASKGPLRTLLLVYLRTYESLRNMLHHRAHLKKRASSGVDPRNASATNDDTAAAPTMRSTHHQHVSEWPSSSDGRKATMAAAMADGVLLNQDLCPLDDPPPGGGAKSASSMTSGVKGTDGDGKKKELGGSVGYSILDLRMAAVAQDLKLVWLRQRRGLDWDDDSPEDEKVNKKGNKKAADASLLQSSASSAVSSMTSSGMGEGGGGREEAGAMGVTTTTGTGTGMGGPSPLLGRDDRNLLTYTAGDREGYALLCPRRGGSSHFSSAGTKRGGGRKGCAHCARVAAQEKRQRFSLGFLDMGAGAREFDQHVGKNARLGNFSLGGDTAGAGGGNKGASSHRRHLSFERMEAHLWRLVLLVRCQDRQHPTQPLKLFRGEPLRKLLDAKFFEVLLFYMRHLLAAEHCVRELPDGVTLRFASTSTAAATGGGIIDDGLGNDGEGAGSLMCENSKYKPKGWVGVGGGRAPRFPTPAAWDQQRQQVSGPTGGSRSRSQSRSSVRGGAESQGNGSRSRSSSTGREGEERFSSAAPSVTSQLDERVKIRAPHQHQHQHQQRAGRGREGSEDDNPDGAASSLSSSSHHQQLDPQHPLGRGGVQQVSQHRLAGERPRSLSSSSSRSGSLGGGGGVKRSSGRRRRRRSGSDLEAAISQLRSAGGTHMPTGYR